MIGRIALLNPDQCSRVLGQVQKLRAAWTQRVPGLPFYTLGAASYLDTAAAARGRYRKKAAAENPLLEREFGWLYDLLLRALEEHLQSKVAFEPDAARPGFHIFLSHESFRRPLGTVHFDLQFAGIEWPEDRELDRSQPVSYTLAIRLPRSGAGLRVWNFTKAEYDAMDPKPDLQSIGGEDSLEYVAYREGEMVCHSGMLLHQIAPAEADLQPDDMRVTLQGHALPGRDGYWLYW